MTLNELKLLKELLDDFNKEYRDYENVGTEFLLETEINYLENKDKEV